MKFIQTHSAGGDCTAPYNITDYHEIVADFVGEVLNTYKGEWGYFEIDGRQLEYRYGKLLNEIPCNVLGNKIVSVKARGGWSNMDYYIKTKPMNHTGKDEEQETIIMSPYEAEFCEIFCGKPLNYYCPDAWKLIKEDYAKLKEIVKRELAEERYKS